MTLKSSIWLLLKTSAAERNVFFSAHERTVGISLPGGATGIGDHFLESFEGKGPNNYHPKGWIFPG